MELTSKESKVSDAPPLPPPPPPVIAEKLAPKPPEDGVIRERAKIPPPRVDLPPPRVGRSPFSTSSNLQEAAEKTAPSPEATPSVVPKSEPVTAAIPEPPKPQPAPAAIEIPVVRFEKKEPTPIPAPPKEAPAREEKPIAKKDEPVFLATEPLVSVPKVASLSNQDELQDIFMTEEALSIEKVLELCGAFPGISSCILAKGESVVGTFNVPDSIDLVSLTANAIDMLDAMRASSAKMGLGAIPAVTIHSAKGPVSFFHRDDLCLLVLHKDRGFIPGVRERLHDVVVALGRANIPALLNVRKP